MVPSLLEPFLTKYQTNNPLLPFLYTDLSLLFVRLLQKFVKSSRIPDNLNNILKGDLSDKKISGISKGGI